MSKVGAISESESDMLRRVGLRTILREDYLTHRHDWTRPGLQALWIHRIGVYGTTLRRPWRSMVTVFHALGHLLCRNVYGIEIERTVQFGRRMHIGHQHGIVIHKWARFGDDCMVIQGVTFGVGTEWIDGLGPVIGNNVRFGPGAVILGNIRIGDNVQIGPNCVVMNDVPANRSLFVAPPRVLPRPDPAAETSGDTPESEETPNGN